MLVVLSSLLCSFDRHCINCYVDGNKGSESFKEKEIVRKEMGLEWMLRPAEKPGRKPTATVDNQPDEPPTEEVCCKFFKFVLCVFLGTHFFFLNLNCCCIYLNFGN